VKNPPPYKETVEHYQRLRNRSDGATFKTCVCNTANVLLVYLCSLVAILWRKVLEKEPVAAVLEKSGEVGPGALFSAQQQQQLVELSAAKGANAEEHLEVYTTELKKMLPDETTGDEIFFMEQAVEGQPAPKETVDQYEESRVPVAEGQGGELTDDTDQPAHPTTPAWPVFTDEYLKYPMWKLILPYPILKCFCNSFKEESKVLLLKKHCFSEKTVSSLKDYETLKGIFYCLETLFWPLEHFVAEAIKPFQNQHLKSINDPLELMNAYQKIVWFLEEIRGQDPVCWIPPDYLDRLSYSLPQSELFLWKQFKQEKFMEYIFEYECFLEFSIFRLGHWSGLIDDRKSRPKEFVSPAAAQPASDQRYRCRRRNSTKPNRNSNPQVPSGSPRINSSRPFSCQVSGCRTTTPHTRRGCYLFLSLPVVTRRDMVTSQNWCHWCLAHSQDRDCFAIKRLAQDNLLPECGEGGCKMPHHPALHQIQINASSLRLEIERRSPVEDQSNVNSSSPISKYFLVSQFDVVLVGGIPAVVQYDGGSQSSSISAQFVSKQGIAGTKCDVLVNGLNDMGARVIEAHNMPIQMGNGRIEN
jgi:hypothetical protein